MNEVKQYDAFDGYGTPLPGKFVRHDDYAALEAKCTNLENSLLAITARHFAESWKKRTSDAELEQYLSAGIAQLESERDTLAAENARLRAELEQSRDLVVEMSKHCNATALVADWLERNT